MEAIRVAFVGLRSTKVQGEGARSSVYRVITENECWVIKVIGHPHTVRVILIVLQVDAVILDESVREAFYAHA